MGTCLAQGASRTNPIEKEKTMAEEESQGIKLPEGTTCPFTYELCMGNKCRLWTTLTSMSPGKPAATQEMCVLKAIPTLLGSLITLTASPTPVVVVQPPQIPPGLQIPGMGHPLKR